MVYKLTKALVFMLGVLKLGPYANAKLHELMLLNDQTWVL